ncbi:MAG: CMP-binding protein, partial [Planctomycetota bacterium]
MSQRQYINQMKPSQRIEGAFTIANAQLGRTKNDKPYLRCLLSDKSAQVPARMWSMDEAHFERLPTDGFVYIEGETQDYQGQLQIVVHQIDPIDPSPEQLADLLPVSARNPDEMLARVEELIASLEHDGVRALGELFLEDEHFMREFTVAPAAKQLHHAHLHGLLEHTVSLMEAAHRLCPLYPGINRDLVVMGCFLQDIGKTRELRYDVGFAYTDLGELVGHIVEGTHM